MELRVQHDETLVGVRLDPGRYKQILYNYLSNAIKFTPESAWVHIRTQALPEAWFRVSVADSGPGITAAHMAQLFTEFQQLENGEEFPLELFGVYTRKASKIKDKS